MDDNTKILLELIKFASRQDMEVLSTTQGFDAITGEQLRKILNDFVSGMGTERDALRARIAYLEGMLSAVGAGGVGQPVRPRLTDAQVQAMSDHHQREEFAQWIAPAQHDSLEITALWQAFCRTAEYRRCLEWANGDEVPGALFVAFRAGTSIKNAAPSQVAPVPQAEPSQYGSLDMQMLIVAECIKKDADSREAKKTIFWSTSYDGKTPHEVFEDEASAREEAKHIGGTCCAIPLVVESIQSKGAA